MQRSVLQQKLPLLRKEVVICPRRKEPVELVLAKGKKHLSKAEIEERKATEVKVDLVDIKAPSYLTEEQSREFEILAFKLKHINIMTELDEDALARYITTKEEYLKIDSLLQKELKKKTINIDKITNIQSIHNKLLNQIRGLASDLGLTISSRVKLVIPIEPEDPKENKFSKFVK